MRYLPVIYIWLFMILVSCEQNVDTETNPGDEMIDTLLQEMTLEEKIGQLTLFTSGWDVTGPVLRDTYREDILSGRCGNLFNAHTVEYNTELQRMAVEETRLGIPLLFGYDVIHGYKTIFPVPIGEACSWDTVLIEENARMYTKEAAAAGLNWTFNPMVDISRDPRWGRVAEGVGEDPFLGSLIARAKVRGIQTGKLDDPFSLAACVKHFAAYGAPEAGRDYATVDMSERVFREVYLPAYDAAIDEGALTVMTSFNELFGVPASASHFLLTEVLRDEMGFDGLVVTDYTAINELVPHGVAADEKEAGELAIKAGVDMDMQSAIYYSYLEDLVEEEKVSIDLVNRSVRRVLELKYKLGLFDDPYLYLDSARQAETLLSEEIMEHALKAAQKSIVLLENKKFENKRLLPIDTSVVQNIALIGPLGDNKLDVLGSWHGAGEAKNTVSVLEGLKKKMPGKEINYVKACDIEGEDRSGFGKALELASNADLVILAVGENYRQSGEAASRSNPELPGVQPSLVDSVIHTGKPVIILIFAGRPLLIRDISEKAPAIIYAWQPGSRTGDALADILIGDYNPSAKLVMSFPVNAGQIPVYYGMKNTGRPFNPDQKYTSKYLDIPNAPLYPFGYGLSYTRFEYSPVVLSRSEIGAEDSLTARVVVKNTGKYAGEEIVQFYIRDMVGTVTRPVKELKGFRKINLQPGESKEVIFTVDAEDLKFYNREMEFVSEPGDFKLYIGRSSADVLEAGFRLVDDR